MRECAHAERLRPRPVRDRPRDELCRPPDDLATSQGIAGVGGQLGFDADDASRGPERPDGHRDAARQPAPADGYEDGRGVREVLDDLEPDRTLTGDDAVVVVRRDDRQAAPGGELFGDTPPLLAGGADDEDLGAIGSDPIALDARRVGGHDDDGGRPEQSRGPSNSLCVVAGRVRDHAARELVSWQRRHGRVRTAKLERPDGLERLGLEEATRLRRSERDQRGSQGDAAHAFGGSADITDGHERGSGLGSHRRSRAASR